MSKIKIIGQEIKCPKCGFIQFFDIKCFKEVKCFNCGNHFDLKKKMVKSNLIRREDIIKLIEKEIKYYYKEMEKATNLKYNITERISALSKIIKKIKGDKK